MDMFHDACEFSAAHTTIKTSSLLPCFGRTAQQYQAQAHRRRKVGGAFGSRAGQVQYGELVVQSR